MSACHAVASNLRHWELLSLWRARSACCGRTLGIQVLVSASHLSRSIQSHDEVAPSTLRLAQAWPRWCVILRAEHVFDVRR